MCAPFLPYHKENVKFENVSCLLVTLQIGPNQKQIVQAYLNKKTCISGKIIQIKSIRKFPIKL